MSFFGVGGLDYRLVCLYDVGLVWQSVVRDVIVFRCCCIPSADECSRIDVSSLIEFNECCSFGGDVLESFHCVFLAVEFRSVDKVYLVGILFYLS